jgi:hypothetical protein
VAKRAANQREDVSSTRRALRALTALRPSLDSLEATLVERARREVVSWEEIGADLGVTKQTAHRRHAGRDPMAVGGRPKRRSPELEHVVTGFDEDDHLIELLAHELETQKRRAKDQAAKPSSAARDVSDTVTPG